VFFYRKTREGGDEMRFYQGGKFESSNRVSLRNYTDLFNGRSVMVYTTDEDIDMIYLESYDGKPNVPKCAIKKIDDKGRVGIPASLRRGAVGFLVSLDNPKAIILKLIFTDSWDDESEEPG
jgi:hypothetical protein